MYLLKKQTRLQTRLACSIYWISHIWILCSSNLTVVFCVDTQRFRGSLSGVRRIFFSCIDYLVQVSLEINHCWQITLLMRFSMLNDLTLCSTVILLRNQPLTATALLKGGADGNRLNKNKCSPLHVAVNKGYTQVVKTFLNSSCNVNAQVCTCTLQYIFVHLWCSKNAEAV